MTKRFAEYLEEARQACEFDHDPYMDAAATMLNELAERLDALTKLVDGNKKGGLKTVEACEGMLGQIAELESQDLEERIEQLESNK